MASIPQGRPPVTSGPVEGGPGAGRFSVGKLRLLPIPVFVVAALAGAGALLLTSRDQVHVEHTAVPQFVKKTLGSRTPGAKATERSSAGTTTTVLDSGLRAVEPQRDVRITQPDGAAAWTRFARGTTRTTAYGREAIVLGGPHSDGEQYLIVGRHLGSRTWTWRLDVGDLVPTLRPDGSVLVSPEHVVAGFRILPFAIYDVHGRNVTPKGLGWGLERKHGSWRLTLVLDDRKLPLPYVVDPSAEGFRAAGTGNSGAGATSVTVTKPAGLALNDLMVAAITVRGGTNVAVCAPTATGTWTSFLATNRTTNLHQELFWKVATASDVSATNYVFSFGTAAGCATPSSQVATGGIGAFFGVDNASPIDASGGQSNASSVNVIAPAITNGTVGNFLLGVSRNPRNLELLTTHRSADVHRAWDTVSVGRRRPRSSRRRSPRRPDRRARRPGSPRPPPSTSASSSRSRSTSSNPTNVLTIASVGAGNAFLSGTNLYYRGSALGNFQLQNAVTDGGSGPASSQFPALGGTTTGWTHTTQTVNRPRRAAPT